MTHEFELTQFQLSGKASSCEPYGEGHINETFLVETDLGKKYILQKINNSLFTNVEALMNNISLVTNHVKSKLEEWKETDIFRKVLQIILTKSGQNYFKNEKGEFFRMYVFIENATAFQIVEKPQHFFESARAFGLFQNHLADFDATKLYDVLPNFHNTVVRFENLKTAIFENKSDRREEVMDEIKFAVKRGHYCDRIVSLIEKGEMPLKVTHNDTKLNNVMIDDKTGKAVAVIDLDTVMAGSSCYDFGDSIRFGCNSGAEDERDLSKVNFKMDLFEAYAKGYIGELKDTISKVELENLAFGAILMTYECGIRFLTDHLNGDTYFKIHREGHNLDRARTQFKLVADMEKVLDEMNNIVQKCMNE